MSYIYKRLKAEGLSPRDKYSNITDNELDTEVKSLHSQYPNAGAEVSYCIYSFEIGVYSLMVEGLRPLSLRTFTLKKKKKMKMWVCI